LFSAPAEHRNLRFPHDLPIRRRQWAGKVRIMGASVLVVDDVRTERQRTEECLYRAGYEVAAASNGLEALARIDLHPIDLVLTEINLPGMDGLDLVRRLTEREPAVPVVVLTSQSSDVLAIEAFRSGAKDYLRKQDLFDQLPLSLRRVFDALEEERRRYESSAWVVAQRTTFRIASNRRHVCPLVHALCQLGRRLGTIAEQEEVRVAVALEEALLNAIIHGNLEVSSRLKELDGCVFDDFVAERESHPHYGRRVVEVVCEVTPREVRYQITDEGPGFDVAQVPDPCNEDRLGLSSGRGILMMRAFMDEVIYTPPGNRVTLVKRCDAQAATSAAGHRREMCTAG
jgi:CheY-like chemotaxis protein